MNLTIVVTTIPQRAQLLSRCLWYLEHQSNPNFEVIVAHGPRPKGDKINRTLPLVETSHVMIVDDDDWVSQRLVDFVLPYTTDFVGYDSILMVEGKFDRMVVQLPGSHICPIRTDIAKQIEFGNDYSSDYQWQRLVAERLNTTEYIHEPLYFYDKWNGVEKWSPSRNVGHWPVDKSKFRWV